MENLNSDLLHTFLAVADTGSMTEGASRIFRSQSAASLQIKRLEEILGQPVFERHGRGVVLTPAGERLLPTARDVTTRLDATLRAFTADTMEGKLRLGIPDDRSRGVLAMIVGEFAQAHPRVELDVTCNLSAGFPRALETGALDLAVFEVEDAVPGDHILAENRTFWMTSPHHDLLARDPVPVALFDRDCWWRDVALASLQAAGRPFRVVYSSQSVAGMAAAIEAGVAIGLLSGASRPDSLKTLGPEAGFGPTPASKLVLRTRPGSKSGAIDAMQSAIRRAYGQPSPT